MIQPPFEKDRNGMAYVKAFYAKFRSKSMVKAKVRKSGAKVFAVA